MTTGIVYRDVPEWARNLLEGVKIILPPTWDIHVCFSEKNTTVWGDWDVAPDMDSCCVVDSASQTANIFLRNQWEVSNESIEKLLHEYTHAVLAPLSYDPTSEEHEATEHLATHLGHILAVAYAALVESY